MLRKEELLIELDIKEAGRLVGSKDVPAERKRLPRGRVYTREVEELAFSRLEYVASRPYLRLNRNLRLSEKVIVEVRRTVNGKEVRIVYEPKGNNPLVTAEGLVE